MGLNAGFAAFAVKDSPILINGRFLTQRITGVQRFGREILRASSEAGLLNAKNAAILAPRSHLGAPDLPAFYAGIPVTSIGQRTGHVWEQIDLPREVSGDTLINLCNAGPMVLRRQMIVLHDAAVAAQPQNYTLAFRAWYNAMVRVYGYRAQTIATVSTFSADEIVKRFGIKAEKIEIISESGEHILRETPDFSLHEKYSLDNDGYFLAVSSLASNKNFSGILKAVARLPALPFKFVIVGAGNAKIFSGAKFDTLGAIETGYVSDGQLRALYERAACFIYPSFYEGFGIPPVEAMSCGCPTLVSRTASLPEVCGDGAAYCDPYDADDIAKQLALLLGSKAARDDLRTAGLARARHWTWNAAAHQLAEVTAHLHA